MPDFSLENEHGSIVIGVDEVGRGPLAGPVVAAAVYIPLEKRNHPVWKEVNDSKKLSAVKRDILFFSDKRSMPFRNCRSQCRRN